MTKRRVVVTGLGLVTPVGNTVATAWENIVNGVSGVRTITDFDASAFATQFSASVRDFKIEDYFEKKEARRMDTFIHFGVAAGIQAMDDAGFEVSEANAGRIGVAIGSGIGGLPNIERQHSALLNGCLLYTSPSPRDLSTSRMPSSA